LRSIVLTRPAISHAPQSPLVNENGFAGAMPP
jgi:hypothetical protein